MLCRIPDLGDGIDPVFGRLDPCFDAGVLCQQVEEMGAAQEFKRLGPCPSREDALVR